MSQRLDQLLQDCTVKITVPGGWGTGFFVAPGLILTCDHVVQVLKGDARAQIDGQQRRWAEAEVVERRPEVDLALLRCSPLPNGEMPCGYLGEAFQPQDDLYTYGYSDSFPEGTSVTGVCEGPATENGSELLVFKLAQVRPGLSGAPLLNLRTGRICGLVSFTRDRSIDLGGGAIPTRVILEQFPQLWQLQQQAHQQDSRWAQLLPEITAEASQTVHGDVVAGDKVGRDKIGTQNNYYIQGPENPTSDKSSRLTDIDFNAYLRSLVATYEKWWDITRLTEAISARQATFTFEQRAQTEERSKEDPTKKETLLLPQLIQGIIDYAESEPVLLVGSPGVGKSTTLLRLLAVLTKQELQKSAPRIPVLVRLKDYQISLSSSEDFSGMLTLIKEALEPELFLEISEIKSLLLQEKRLFLLLDGLNEIPANVVRSKLNDFRDQCKRAKIPLICSTRNLGDDFGIQRQVNLNPLDPKEIRRFLSECMPGQEQQVLQLLNKGNQELSKTPFVLWMLYDVSGNLGQIPESLGEAFSRFTKNYTNYKINQEGIPYSHEMLQNWSFSLEYLAFEMLKSPDPQDPVLIITERQAVNVLTQRSGINTIDPIQVQIEAQKLLDNLLKYHLVQKSHKGEISFCHQLIQEYYAAEYLLRLLQPPDGMPGLTDDQLKRDYLNYLKWTEPVVLMLALVDSGVEAVRLVQQALDVDWRLGASLAEYLESKLIDEIVEKIFESRLPTRLEIELLGLTRSQNSRVISYLESYLNNSSPDVRKITVKAFGRIRSDRNISVLGPLLEDKSIEVFWQTVTTLEKIGGKSATDTLYNQLFRTNDVTRYKAIVKALKNLRDENIVDQLINALDDEDPSIRCRSAQSLGDIGNRKAIPRLKQFLLDQNHEVKWKVTCALCKLGDDEAISKLVRWLDAPQKPLTDYESICEALSIIGGEKAINALLNALESSSHDIFYMAANALGKLQCKKAIPIILNVWRHKDSLWLQNIPDVLEEIQCKDACSILMDFLLDDELDGYARVQAAYSLGKLDCKDCIPALIITSQNKNSGIRSESIEALGNIGFKANPDIFYQALNDKDKSVQWTARRALVKTGISDRMVVSALIDMLEACEYHEEFGCYNYLEEISWTAAEALGYLDGSILPLLQKSILVNRSADTPHLEALIYVIDKIQGRCQFYNHELWQEAEKTIQSSKLEIQKSTEGDISGQAINQFPNATEVKIFERVEHYHEHSPDSNS